jgi:hypothetical protein
MIKISKILFYLFPFLLLNCQKPGPVEIIDELDDSKSIEVTALGTSNDSVFVGSGIDSTGLIGLENSKYFGKLILSGIRYDKMDKTGNIITTESISADAIFLDQTSPLYRNGHLVTYASLDAGNIKINSDSLEKIQRHIVISSSDTAIGFIYHLRLPYNYQSSYTWNVEGRNTIGAFQHTFTPAPVLRILNLQPDTINISSPLFLKWQCNNTFINIIISGEEEVLFGQRKLQPVLQLRIQNKKSEITLPVKILQLIPIKKYNRFLFTFSSDSNALTNIPGYSDPVLIHSASIHNILLNVRP